METDGTLVKERKEMTIEERLKRKGVNMNNS